MDDILYVTCAVLLDDKTWFYQTVELPARTINGMPLMDHESMFEKAEEACQEIPAIRANPDLRGILPLYWSLESPKETARG